MEKLEEKVKYLQKEDERHERRLNDHSKRIDVLEQFRSSTEAIMENLLKQIQSLIYNMRWFMGLMVGSLVSFFIWYIQQLGR